MRFYYITFRSVTYAQRGEQVLTEAGIRCSLQRTPRWMETQGCGYALRIWIKEIDEALSLLRRSGIVMRKLYRQKADGQLEEIPL